MATIYSSPSQIPVPELDFQNFNNYLKECEEYKIKLKEFISKSRKGKNIGEIIQFPVADGYAEYMVASMNPPELIHIPTGDAWEFQYAHLLGEKEIQQEIDKQKALKQLFSK
jgi:hypothetical protein